jgi:hypothetical protein
MTVTTSRWMTRLRFTFTRYASGGPLWGGATTACEPPTTTLEEDAKFCRNLAAKTAVSGLLVCCIANVAVGAAAAAAAAGGGCQMGRPRFGLVWPPVQESPLRTQRRQDGQLLSHLVRAVRQALQLKGNFLDEVVVVLNFCFLGGGGSVLCDDIGENNSGYQGFGGARLGGWA